MKHGLLAFSFLIIVVSCNSYSNEETNMKQILEDVNKYIYNKSDIAISKLSTIDSENLSQKNKAFYNLIYSIAIQEYYGSFDNDSIISYSLNWYKYRKDWINYCRSSLYKGIALFNISKFNSDAYFYVKQAENLYINHNLKDNILESKIYLYLGKLSRSKQDYFKSEKYLLISREMCVRLKRINDEHIVRLELFWTYLAQRKFKDALENIIGFEEASDLTPEMQYSLFNAIAGYYSAKNEYSMSAEYTKKIVLLMNEKPILIDKPKLYHTLSSYYKRSNSLDSSLRYSILAVKSISDSLSTENHLYYKYLADIYALRGNYIEAYENYKNAYRNYILAYSNIAVSRELEIEDKFDTSLLETQLLTNVQHKNIFIVLSMTLFCLSTIVISNLIQKYFRSRKVICAIEIQRDNQNQELKKYRLINELLLIPAELLVEFSEDIYNQACKNRKASPELFEAVNKSIDNIKSKTKSMYSVIANDDSLYKDNPNLKDIPEFSDLEKLIFTLKVYGYSSQEIARFLCSSPPRIRAINAKLKEKVSNNELLR